MTLQGQVKNGVVVFENGAALPEGTPVTVRPVKKSAAKGRAGATKSPRRRKLLGHAGKAKGLPADAAGNLDHYLYGHVKK